MQDHHPDEAKAMATYGITHVPMAYYHLGEYRYTSLKDAIAAGKRLQPPSENPDRGPAGAADGRGGGAL